MGVLSRFSKTLKRFCLSVFLVFSLVCSCGCVLAMDLNEGFEKSFKEYVEGEFRNGVFIASDDLVFEPCLHFQNASKGSNVAELVKILLKFSNDETRAITHYFCNKHRKSCEESLFKGKYSFEDEEDALAWLEKLEKSNRLNFIVKERNRNVVIGLFSVCYVWFSKKSEEENNINVKKTDDDVEKEVVNRDYYLACNMFLDPAFKEKFYDFEAMLAFCKRFASCEDIIMFTGLMVDGEPKAVTSLSRSNDSSLCLEKAKRLKKGQFFVNLKRGQHDIFGKYSFMLCLNYGEKRFKDFIDIIDQKCDDMEFFDDCVGLKGGQIFLASGSRECGGPLYLTAELSNKKHLKSKVRGWSGW